MSDTTTHDCDHFDERVEELALGLVPEPERRALLDHARTCPACRALLDELQRTGDELLLLAPEVEPSADFATRTVAAMTGSATVPVTSHRAARRRRWVAPLTAVAAACVLLAAGFLLGTQRDDGVDTLATATIERSDGSAIGRFTLLESDRTVALVEIAAPTAFEGRRRCLVTLADGSKIDVGGWTAEEISTGAWSVAVDPFTADPVRMDVLDESGTVLATATL